MGYVLSVIYQVGILIVFSLAGNLLVAKLSLNIPGSIVGIILLFLCLELKIIRIDAIEAGADFLLVNLLLFFIPSAVGILQYQDLLAVQGIRLVLVIMLSTVIVMSCTGLLAEVLVKARRN